MKRNYPILTAAVLSALVVSCGVSGPVEKQMTTKHKNEPVEPNAETQLATFGAGCFWCTEAVFERLAGVVRVESGYMGGTVDSPTYKQVCTGQTGHAEVIQLAFDPAKVSYEELLRLFWKSHDPTTLNRQGADRGTQYRSAVFYHSDEQRQAAEKVKKELTAAGAFDDPIVTEITPASTFWRAENYHQDYYELNKRAPYCRIVIEPKLKKLGLGK